MPAFNNLRRKLRRRRAETILLAGYAFAITFALFISLLYQSSSSPKLPIRHLDDNYDYNADILTPAFSDSSKDNPFEITYMQVNDIKLLSDDAVVISKFELSQDGNKVVLPPENKPQYGEISGIYRKERRVLVVSSGDTFIALLTSLGMDTKSATEAYNVLKKVYDAKNLKVGQNIELTATFDVQTRQLETLDSLVIEPERGTKYILKVNEYDKFVASVEREKFAADVRLVRGKVNGTVSNSLMSAGVPRRLANEVINNMSHMINFRSGVHKGDTFEVKYEVSKAADGEVVKVGNLLSAGFTIGKRKYKIYRFKNGYYDERGQAKKTGLDIKPLAMRNARISSLFGYRKHPIYKTQKFHSGVDYAAPKGTAIYASGNGVVKMAQYVNGYGNYIKISHNSEYETAYGHMQKFAPGMRPGVKVRKGQIIGYVGSTGRSTGPHLHFEILRKGEKINPLKAKVATGNDLGGAQLAEFKKVMRRIDNSVEKIAKKENKENKNAAAPTETVTAESKQSAVAEKENTVRSVQEVSAAEAKVAAAPAPVEKTVEKVSDLAAPTAAAQLGETSTVAASSDVKNEDIKNDSAVQKKTYYPPVAADAVRYRYLKASGKLIKLPPHKPKYAKK